MFPQKQASQADHSAYLDFHNPGLRLFIRQLLGDEGYAWDPKDSQKTILHLNSVAPRANAYLVIASDVVFRFRLLDIYAEALAISSKGKYVTVPRIAQPLSGSRRVEQVRISLYTVCSH